MRRRVGEGAVECGGWVGDRCARMRKLDGRHARRGTRGKSRVAGDAGAPPQIPSLGEGSSAAKHVNNTTSTHPAVTQQLETPLFLRRLVAASLYILVIGASNRRAPFYCYHSCSAPCALRMHEDNVVAPALTP